MDRLWKAGLSSPIAAIEQIFYWLYMKCLEDFHLEKPENYNWSNYQYLKREERAIHKRKGVTFWNAEHAKLFLLMRDGQYPLKLKDLNLFSKIF